MRVSFGITIICEFFLFTAATLSVFNTESFQAQTCQPLREEGDSSWSHETMFFPFTSHILLFSPLNCLQLPILKLILHALLFSKIPTWETNCIFLSHFVSFLSHFCLIFVSFFSHFCLTNCIFFASFLSHFLW